MLIGRFFIVDGGGGGGGGEGLGLEWSTDDEMTRGYGRRCCVR